MIFTLGPEGTYSELTAKQYFGENSIIKLLPTISDIFDQVNQNPNCFGVVPLENIIEGTVRETYDQLYETDLKIWDISTTQINHSLVSQNNDFTIIASHSQALAQCRKFIRKNYPKCQILNVSSTAEGCKLATQDSSIAAISSPNSIANYPSLKIINSNVSDYFQNQTDFAIITNRANPKTCQKSIAIIEPTKSNEPGLLLKILYPFQENNVDLSKLESRPNKNKPSEYLFFIEFEGDARQARARKIFTYLEKDLKICKVKAVGGKTQT